MYFGGRGLFNKDAWGEVFKNIDRPSNALQGLFVGGKEGLKSGWNQEKNYDFEQLWSEDLAKQGYYERDALGRLSYVGSGALNLLLDPINFTGLGSLFKGLKATKTAAGNISPVGYVADRAMLSEMPNRLETLGIGFYDKGLASKALTSTSGAVEGVLKSINRELNPAMIKQQKLYNTTGITTQTTSTIDDVMAQLNDPQLQAMATNLATKGKKNLTKKESKFLKDWENLGKILQGQLGYNFLEKEAYQLGTKLGGYKSSHFFSDALPLQKESFVQGAKQFSSVADEAYQLSDDILGQVFDKIMVNQKIVDPSKSRLYFKQPSVSNANAVRISNEVSSLAKKRKLAKELFNTGKKNNKGKDILKPFSSTDDLSKALSQKEWTEPVRDWMGKTVGTKTHKGIDHTIIKGKNGEKYAMFSDSYLSGDNLLGGVNVVHLLDKNGKVFSVVNDAQDIFKFKFPGGQTPIVVTNILTGDFLGNTIKRIKKPPTPPKEGMMLGGHKKNPRSRPSVSPQLYSSAQAIKELQKNIHLNPLDYLSYFSKVNIASEPFQNASGSSVQ